MSEGRVKQRERKEGGLGVFAFFLIGKKLAITLGNLEKLINHPRVHAMTFGRPSMLHSPHHTTLPQMIDDEYFAVDVDEADRQQPLEIPCKSAYFASIVKLSDITAEILR